MSIVQRQKVTTHIFQNLQESTKTKCLVSRNHTIHKFGVYLYELFFLITTKSKMCGQSSTFLIISKNSDGILCL